MKDSCLRWFDHAQRRPINTPVRKHELIEIKERKKKKKKKKSRGRPKILLVEVIENDMLIKKETTNMTSNKIE